MNDNLENRKWKKASIEAILNSYQDGLKSNKGRHDGRAREYLSSLKSKRDITFTVMGIILTVILGITSTSIKFMPDSERLFLLNAILLAILPAAGLVYLFVTILIHGASNLFSEIEKSYALGFTVQNYMKGFLSIRTRDIGSITEDQLDALSDYFRMVEAGITWYLIMMIRKVVEVGIFNDEVSKALYLISVEKGYEIYDKRGKILGSSMVEIFKRYKEDYTKLFEQFDYFVQLLPGAHKSLEAMAGEMWLEMWLEMAPSPPRYKYFQDLINIIKHPNKYSQGLICLFSAARDEGFLSSYFSTLLVSKDTQISSEGNLSTRDKVHPDHKT